MKLNVSVPRPGCRKAEAADIALTVCGGRYRPYWRRTGHSQCNGAGVFLLQNLFHCHALIFIVVRVSRHWESTRAHPKYSQNRSRQASGQLIRPTILVTSELRALTSGFCMTRPAPVGTHLLPADSGSKSDVAGAGVFFRTLFEQPAP